MMREHRELLERIERWFGVQRRFVVAIWGAETGCGPYAGDVPVFQALATLAWEPRRAPYFRSKLFDALRIVQRGHIELRRWSARGPAPWDNPSSCHRVIGNTPTISIGTAAATSGIRS
jgi:membrane-bound lytic murein transglycosylase B